jgi:hypothetical protein
MDGDLVADAHDCAPTDATRWYFQTMYIDTDGDHYAVGMQTLCVGSASEPGYSAYTYGDDCNDHDASETYLRYAYIDQDHDGVGTGTATPMCVASVPAGYSEVSGDCDDTNAAVSYPIRAYADLDGDHYGAGVAQYFCVAAAANLPAGYVVDNTDCNDSDPAAHTRFFGYADNDHDGYGVNPLVGVCAAALPAAYVTNNYDTDDTNPNINIRHVTASVYQPASSPYCNGSYCAGVIDVVLTQDVPTEVTVSSYSRALWCLYGRSSNTHLVATHAMGYYLNLLSPQYYCGLGSTQYACNSMVTSGGVTYYLLRPNLAAQCIGEGSNAHGTYISNYDVYSSSLLVR